MKSRGFKNLLVNFGICVIALVLVIVAGEIIVRLLYKDQTVLFPRYHTDAHYGQYRLRKIRPNAEFRHTSRDGSWKFTINKQGFRSTRNFLYEKPEDTIRIITLGDSHTQGYEVRQEYTYSAVIEKYLKEKGYRAEVLNTGVSGFSTAEELVFLEQEGVRYSPDFVVLGFYANDFQDNIKANLFRLAEDGGLILQKKAHIPGVRIQNLIYGLPLVKWLSENSYFYSLLFNNTWDFFKARLKRKATENIVEYAVPTEETFTDYQTSLAAALIRRMYGFCHEHNCKLVILDIPKASKKTSVKSSLTPALLQGIEGFYDGHIDSEALLADYNNVAELHVPHGQRHISEFTHVLLGRSVAREIIALNP